MIAKTAPDRNNSAAKRKKSPLRIGAATPEYFSLLCFALESMIHRSKKARLPWRALMLLVLMGQLALPPTMFCNAACATTCIVS